MQQRDLEQMLLCQIRRVKGGFRIQKLGTVSQGGRVESMLSRRKSEGHVGKCAQFAS